MVALPPGMTMRTFRYGGMSRHYPPTRVAINRWVREPGYKVGREFRLQALSRAFGLGETYLRKYCAGLASMGSALEREILQWTAEHPDLSQNNAEFEITFFATIRPE